MGVRWDDNEARQTFLARTSVDARNVTAEMKEERSLSAMMRTDVSNCNANKLTSKLPVLDVDMEGGLLLW
jgi:hypothetical protein